MSFKCDNCGVGQQPGSKPHRHVETREVRYKSAFRVIEGKEIAKEMKLCGRCNLALSKGIPLYVTKRQVTREAGVDQELELRQQGTPPAAEESIVARDLWLRRQAKAERREANREVINTAGMAHRSFTRRKRGRT